MSTERTPATTIAIIVLLVANLGLSAYIALRPAPSPAQPKDAVTSDVSSAEATKMAEAIVPLYNQGKMAALYELFDPLAKAQFTEAQLTSEMGKLESVLGKIENYAYSHATIAGTQAGRTFYILHFKVRLSGSMPTGDMTLSVARSPKDLGLFGFFVNGGSGPRPQ